MYKLLAIASLLAVTGCASTTGGQLHPTSDNGQAPLAEVPSIKIVIDCAPCQVRPSVSPLILEGYREAATESGMQVSSTLEATVTIKQYSDRNDAARHLLGIFAGEDAIQANVTYQEKTFIVEDYYRNAWLGIESLAKKIGEMVFAQMKL